HDGFGRCLDDEIELRVVKICRHGRFSLGDSSVRTSFCQDPSLAISAKRRTSDRPRTKRAPFATGAAVRDQAAFSSFRDHSPSEAKPFILARCVNALWAAASFSALPPHAFSAAACKARP